MPRGRVTWLSLEGRRFSRLVVVKEAERFSKYVRGWECKCDCGTIVIVRQGNLISGNNKSCGCLDMEHARKLYLHTATHQKTYRSVGTKLRTPTYTSWQSMKSRCYAPKTHGFHNWGGKGIKVCDEWKNDFTAFLRDMGERPEGTTLDRLDANGDYTPQNCRWATSKEQAHDRKGGTPKLSREQVDYIKTNLALPLRELVERFNVSKSTIKKIRRTGRER